MRIRDGRRRSLPVSQVITKAGGPRYTLLIASHPASRNKCLTICAAYVSNQGPGGPGHANNTSKPTRNFSSSFPPGKGSIGTRGGTGPGRGPGHGPVRRSSRLGPVGPVGPVGSVRSVRSGAKCANSVRSGPGGAATTCPTRHSRPEY